MADGFPFDSLILFLPYLAVPVFLPADKDPVTAFDTVLDLVLLVGFLLLINVITIYCVSSYSIRVEAMIACLSQDYSWGYDGL